MELSPLIYGVWQLAALEAVRAKEECIQPDHFFLAALKTVSAYGRWQKAVGDLPKERRAEVEAPPPILDAVHRQLGMVGLDADRVRSRLRERRGQGGYEWPEKPDTVHRSEASRRVFRRGEEVAGAGSGALLITHLLLALVDEDLLDEGGKRFEVLHECGIGVARLRAALAPPPGPDSHATRAPRVADHEPPTAKPSMDVAEPVQAPPPRPALRRHPTPVMDRFGRDLTQLARDGKLPEPVGRRKEMLQIVRTLQRETRNNPVLVGEAGVGTTAVVEGLAWRIAMGRAPEVILGTRVVQLDMAALTAGTKYRGDFEERLNGIVREARDTPGIVLFVDEIHQLVGGGGAGSGTLDASELLKPALARGELRMIGATTPEEYRLIEKDKALERRFQAVPVSEPTRAETFEILEAVAARKADAVKIDDAALHAAVELAVRYLSGRRLPDSAIDLLEEACAQVAVRWSSWIPGEDSSGGDGEGEVTAETVAKVVERLKGIPAGRLKEDERERLGRMAATLKQRVVGQDHACDVVAEAMQRARVGLRPAGRPLGVLLFLGPTGVGKTLVAKAAAEFLFGSEQALARLDMSEYREKHTVARLIGSPAGYVGYDDEAQLTGILRRQPYCVMLLDEFDRAHPDVQHLFLQLFDEGRLTDAKGRKADATNALFILTSNLSADVREKPGFRTSGRDEARRALIEQGLTPDLVNRVAEVVVFYPLEPEDVGRIAAQLLERLRGRLKAQGIGLRWDDGVVQMLSDEGSSKEFGARELHRVLERRAENPIAGMVLRHDVRRGHTVVLRSVQGRVTATVEGADERIPE